MFPNVLFEPPPTFKAGYPNEIQVGQVDERFKQKFAVWLVRTAYDQYANAAGIFALSTVCTHLGCTPNWLEAEQKFKCPCHGSGYYKNGVNFEGPTPRPLERYAISLADDGQILVDKSRKFQQEKGEWNNPAVVSENCNVNSSAINLWQTSYDDLRRRLKALSPGEESASTSRKVRSIDPSSASACRTRTANACWSCWATSSFICIR